MANQLSRIVALSPGHMYWKDRAGKYLGCNQNQLKLLGLSKIEQIIGKTDYDLYAKEVADRVRAVDEEVMSLGIEKEFEEIGIGSSGKKAFYLTRKIPLMDDNNQVEGLLGISLNITHRKKAREALRIALDKSEAANRSKSEFIQNMSHDIRNPLAGIVGMAKILYDMTTETTQKYALMLVQSSECLMDLLNNVLDLTSAAQENQLKQEPVELKKLAQGLKALLTPSLYTKQLQLNLGIDPNIPIVVGDANKIERILLNLLNNAIKFTERGHIALEIEVIKRKRKHVQLKFSVTDTGIGIPEDKLHRVFEEFFRVHPSYEGVYKGHGVGLYIVKKYTELMHGSVNVSSKLGEGTTFMITLELSIAKKQSKKQRLESIPIDIKNQININAHIFLIEDDAVQKKAAQLLLQQAGYTVTTASTRTKAQKKLNAQKFDLIITDIGLGTESALDLVEKIRAQEQQEHLPRVPIFALTGHGKEIKEQCLAAGIDQVFTKPLSEKHLQRLRKALRN
jgi:two-component system, OmpR family, aerobic respiration control sensor histidine kinase ArcB